MAQTEEDFEWGDPPRIRNPQPEGPGYEVGARINIDMNLARLKALPGKWARVHTGGGEGTVVRARKYREAGCEVESHRVNLHGARRSLWARWPE